MFNALTHIMLVIAIPSPLWDGVHPEPFKTEVTFRQKTLQQVTLFPFNGMAYFAMTRMPRMTSFGKSGRCLKSYGNNVPTQLRRKLATSVGGKNCGTPPASREKGAFGTTMLSATRRAAARPQSTGFFSPRRR